MLSINTKQDFKTVEIDGLTYRVRKPGAGESLVMQKNGREIQELTKLESLNEAQEQTLETLGMEVLKICVSLFRSDDPKAQDYIQTLDAEILMDVIAQVFDPNEAQVS